MNSKEFIKALNHIVEEKGISKDVVFEAMEQALTTAYKKNFDSKTNVRVDINRETGEIKVFSYLVVVEDYLDGEEIVDEEGNIFLGSMAEASIVRLLCHMVPEIYFLADETKLMKKDFIYICQLGKGRNLITNSSISKKYIHTYEQLGACVITESQKDRR